MTHRRHSTQEPSTCFHAGTHARYVNRQADISHIQTSHQELAFRSAILYGGLLLSNAFGSVRHSLHISLIKWHHDSHYVYVSYSLLVSCPEWKERGESEAGDGEEALSIPDIASITEFAKVVLHRGLFCVSSA